jgi:hypothetical protein
MSWNTRDKIVSSEFFEALMLIEGWSFAVTLLFFIILAVPVKLLTGSLLLAAVLAYGVAYLALLMRLLFGSSDAPLASRRKMFVLSTLSIIVGGGCFWWFLASPDAVMMVVGTQISLILAAVGQRTVKVG